MYAATFEEVVQDTAVIIGTLLIHSAPSVALIDSGSTHAFIAKTIVDRFSVFIEDFGNDLVVLNPIGANLTTTRVCVRGVTMVI